MVKLSKYRARNSRRWLQFETILSELHKPAFLHLGRKQVETPDVLIDFITYGQRLELERLIESKSDLHCVIKVFEILYNLKPKQVLKLKLIEAVPFVLWVIAETKTITESEKEKLHTNLTDIQKAAGIEKLSVFDHFPNIDFLMKEYSLTEDAVMKLKYTFVFVKLWFNKMMTDYDKECTRLSNLANK